MFLGKAWRLTKSGAAERGFPRVCSSPTCRHLTRWEKLTKDKHSSLLRKLINDRRKSFITLANVINVLKLFSSQTKRPNKLKCFLHGKNFKPSPIFQSKANYPHGAKCFIELKTVVNDI